jgi:hypothetical protein
MSNVSVCSNSLLGCGRGDTCRACRGSLGIYPYRLWSRIAGSKFVGERLRRWIMWSRLEQNSGNAGRRSSGVGTGAVHLLFLYIGRDSLVQSAGFYRAGRDNIDCPLVCYPSLPGPRVEAHSALSGLYC